MILTVVRAGGCRQARFEEFEGNLWTVPAERMKGREGQVESFRVPLSPAAAGIIERRAAISSEWVFPGHRGGPLTDAALSKYMRANDLPGTPHGFRTSFRTWVQDNNAADVNGGAKVGQGGGVKSGQLGGGAMARALAT